MTPETPNAARPAWQELVELLVPAGELAALTWYPGDEAVRADLYKQLLMNVALGYFVYFQSDPDHPDWTPFLNSVFLLQPNPDDTYYLAHVRGSGVYRICGERGGVRLLTFATGARMMAMSERPGQGYEQYDADTLTLAQDGSFEVILSHERPAGWNGNWWHLDPDADHVLARQRSYDWGQERDARLAIERVDCAALKPRPSPAEITATIRELLGGFVPRLTKMWLGYQNAMRARETVNRFEFADFGNIGAVRVQHYWQCIFELAPGEALILETDLPKSCRYWNVQLNDPLFNAIEYVYRQSSLNGHQARIDSDGRFRGVLALEDPGVPNWLDTGGYTSGTVMGRWYAADSQPLPVMRRVPVTELRRHLPVDTPVVSGAERARLLSARCRGAQLRRRW